MDAQVEKLGTFEYLFPKLCPHDGQLALTLQSIRMGAEREDEQKTRLIFGV